MGPRFGSFDELVQQLRDRLSSRVADEVQLPGLKLREAAVLVPLLARPEGPLVLFTKRHSGLRNHAGQISFPGGARDDEDVTPLHAALRETHEELGIPPEKVEVLGMLDEIPTITRFRVRPFVGVIRAGDPYALSAEEVEEVIEVPLSHLLQPAVFRTERWERPGVEKEVYFFDYGSHVIWGATARILKNLLSLADDLPAVKALRSK
jgi:8-oxo-dGTP pyrophosphatase MutT (NUDIX family)